MSHVRCSGVLMFLLLNLALSGSALANSTTVNMTFIGTGGNSAGGVYTYPYNFSINGGASTPLVCDTFDNEIVGGEKWKATVSGLLSGKGLFGVNLLDYKAAAVIFKSVLNGNLSATLGNYAIWGLFSSNARNNSFFQSSGAAGIDQLALVSASHLPSTAFKGFVLYTPLAGSQSWGGTPQEFIGYKPPAEVPEPGTLALLGTGLVGIAGVVRQKLAK